MYDRDLKIGPDPKLSQIAKIAEIAESQTNIQSSQILIKIGEITKTNKISPNRSLFDEIRFGQIIPNR